MPSNRKKKGKTLQFTIFLLILILTGVSLPAQERIEWEPVEGADHYRVEILQDGELVLETRSENSWIPLFLPAGDYEFQVKVVNSFGRIETESELSPLKITAPDIPFIIDMLPGEVHEGSEANYRIRVNGLVLKPEERSLFILEDSEGNQIELEYEAPAAEDEDRIGDWEEITLKSRRKEPGEGVWALIMTNPDGRENRMEAALVVLERLRPRIRKFSPREIPAGKNHNQAILELIGMEYGAVIEFNGPSDIQTTLLNQSDDGVLEYSLNLEFAEPGWYSVVITNPSGGFDVKEKTFQVLPRPPSAEEIAAANAIQIDDKEPRPVPSFPHSVYGGWSFNFPVGSATEYIKNGYVGFSLGFSQNFHNDLVRRIPGFSGISWDITFSYSHNRTKFPIIDINLNRYNFLLGLNYVTPFDFPVNLLVRAGAGVGFSIYTSPERDRDEDIGFPTLRDLDSLDFITRFGIGARYDINPRWYIDLTCDFGASFYLSRSTWSVQPRLEGGWRW